MHKKLESIKPLLKAGEYEKAAEALKEFQTEYPDNWDGKLMEGIVAKLRSDEKTFWHIYNIAQDALNYKFGSAQAMQVKKSPLWKKYQMSMEKHQLAPTIEYVLLGIIVASAAIVGTMVLKSALREEIGNQLSLYAIAPYHEKAEKTNTSHEIIQENITK